MRIFPLQAGQQREGRPPGLLPLRRVGLRQRPERPRLGAAVAAPPEHLQQRVGHCAAVPHHVDEPGGREHRLEEAGPRPSAELVDEHATPMHGGVRLEQRPRTCGQPGGRIGGDQDPARGWTGPGTPGHSGPGIPRSAPAAACACGWPTRARGGRGPPAPGRGGRPAPGPPGQS